MYLVLRKSLRKGVVGSDSVPGPIKDINFAKGLLDMLQHQDQLPSVEQLASMDINSSKTFAFEDYPDPEESDLRIVGVYMKGVRAFPPGNTQYSVKFAEGDRPISAVFLGSNGIGKSSVFCALEWACLGHSYLGDERGYVTDEERVEFLRHNQTREAEGLIRLFTKRGEQRIDLVHRPYPIVPPAFFCSEYDIQEISHRGLRSEYIADQIGTRRFHDILQMLRRMQSEYEENKEEFDRLSHDITLIKHMEIVREYLRSLDKDEQNILAGMLPPLTGNNDIERLKDFAVKFGAVGDLIKSQRPGMQVVSLIDGFTSSVKEWIDETQILPASAKLGNKFEELGDRR